MGEVPLQTPFSDGGVEFDPSEVLGRSWGPTVGRMRPQGFLEIKDTHRPRVLR